MKPLTIPATRESEIDWDSPQWLINNNLVVLSTGRNNLNTFSGTCMPCSEYPNGHNSDGWTKHTFTRLTFDIPFVISND